MTSNDQTMLIFTIGPVQPFIEQARKTRDLWTGSLLLAYLMQESMKESSGDIIFPKKQTVDGAKNPTVGRVPNLPNKYIATFPSIEDARAAAEKSRERIEKAWKDIHTKVYADHIDKSALDDEETRQIWERQTKFDSLFEVYWAIMQTGNPDTYKEWLEKTELLLSARKRLRDFRPQDEPGLKSVISGEREALRSKHKDAKTWWREVAQKIHISPHDLSRKEWLDAIDTVKRFAVISHALDINRLKSGVAFPSTSSVAVASFVERLFETEGLNLTHWRQATNNKFEVKTVDVSRDLIAFAQPSEEEEPSLLTKKALQKPDLAWLLKRDGDLYFPAVFAATHLKEDYGFEDSNENEMRNAIRSSLEAQKALFKQTDEAGIARPTPYYAVLRMDGDNMGLLLSGVKQQEEHENISQALSEFAHTSALPTVEQQYPGRLVYAGGDDVLAFAPLIRDVQVQDQPQNILQLAAQLQADYRAKVRAVVADDERKEMVSASAGIVVAHHYTALSYVMRESREAESLAKNRYGRNALVLTILRRSGEHTRVGCHWTYDGLASEGQPIALFSRFLTLFKTDVLSPKCIALLLAEAAALVDIEAEAQKSEVRRVLLRQLSTSKKNQPTRPSAQQGETSETYEDEVKRLASLLIDLAQKMDTEDKNTNNLALDLHADQRRRGLVEVLGWLQAMVFLARKELD